MSQSVQSRTADRLCVAPFRVIHMSLINESQSRWSQRSRWALYDCFGHVQRCAGLIFVGTLHRELSI